MVKPDAFGHAGAIIKRIQEEGYAVSACVSHRILRTHWSRACCLRSFEVVQQAELRLTVEQAQEFYVEHKARYVRCTCDLRPFCWAAAAACRLCCHTHVCLLCACLRAAASTTTLLPT